MKMLRREKKLVKSLRKKICALTLVFSSLTFNFCAASSYGESGAEVAEIQTCLTAQGLYNGAIDGYYGDSTVAAIKDFQSAIGLPADGVCGHVTYELLHAAAYDEIDITTLMNGGASNYLKPGDSGAKVKELQNALIGLGYLSGTADGFYSSETAAAIKNFQSAKGLTIDGLCSKSTLNAIKNSVPIKEVKSNYAEIGSVIKSGMEGPGVVDVQEKLIEAGYLSGAADGYCGLATVEAIKKFQTAKGIKADGVCGIMTYSALENSQYEENLSWQEIIVDEPVFDNPNYGQVVYVEATAYSSQDPGLGLYTARGNLVGHGIISVDPNFIPLGTRVYIPGYGEAIADDTGGAIMGNRIDIAFDTYEEAINFGRQNIEIYILD